MRRRRFARAILWYEDHVCVGHLLAAGAILAGLALLLAGCATARAETTQDGGFWTANELYRFCTDADSMVCYGYLQGASDAWTVFVTVGGGDCSASVGQNARQLRMLFMKEYLRNPEDGHYSAARYVARISGCRMPPEKVQG